VKGKRSFQNMLLKSYKYKRTLLSSFNDYFWTNFPTNRKLKNDSTNYLLLRIIPNKKVGIILLANIVLLLTFF